MEITTEVASEFVKNFADLVIDNLGLTYWRDTINYSIRTGLDQRGKVQYQGAYYSATIFIDPIEHDSAEDLIETFVHEHLHLLFSDFDNAKMALELNDGVGKHLLNYAEERTLHKFIRQVKQTPWYRTLESEGSTFIQNALTRK